MTAVCRTPCRSAAARKRRPLQRLVGRHNARCRLFDGFGQTPAPPRAGSRTAVGVIGSYARSGYGGICPRTELGEIQGLLAG
jgi:hypothetical protein